MKFKKFDIKYRKSLDELCGRGEFKNAILFKQIRTLIPPSLKIKSPADTSEKQVNCHGYTFNKDCWYEVINVHKMINTGEIRPVDEPKENDIVVYYLDGSKIPIIKHTGRYLENGKVISKWANGPVFEHEILNVPFTYGETVKFFRE